MPACRDGTLAGVLGTESRQYGVLSSVWLSDLTHALVCRVCTRPHPRFAAREDSWAVYSCALRNSWIGLSRNFPGYQKMQPGISWVLQSKAKVKRTPCGPSGGNLGVATSALESAAKLHHAASRRGRRSHAGQGSSIRGVDDALQYGSVAVFRNHRRGSVRRHPRLFLQQCQHGRGRPAFCAPEPA